MHGRMVWRAGLLLAAAACVVLVSWSAASADEPRAPQRLPAPKATGEVWFWNGDLWARADFSAHEEYGSHPAKGEFYYEDSDDEGNMRYYQFMVTCAIVDRENATATFSGQICDTNVPDWQDKWVQIWVYDGGTPGSEGDTITGQMFDEDPMCEAEPPMAEPLPVVEGNLKVH
jgi:hypothetical protein